MSKSFISSLCVAIVCSSWGIVYVVRVWNSVVSVSVRCSCILVVLESPSVSVFFSGCVVCSPR